MLNEQKVTICKSVTNKRVLFIGNTYLFFIMNDHVYIPCLVDIFVFVNAYESFTAIDKYFIFCHHICFFFQIYDPLCIPYSEDIFVYTNAYEVFTTIEKHFTLATYLFFHIYDHSWIPCLADIFHFSLFMPISFEIVNTCV